MLGHESRRCRADEDAGKQVADQRRDFDPLGDEPEDQGHAEAGGNSGDQRNVVIHSVSFVGLPDERAPFVVRHDGNPRAPQLK